MEILKMLGSWGEEFFTQVILCFIMVILLLKDWDVYILWLRELSLIMWHSSRLFSGLVHL